MIKVFTDGASKGNPGPASIGIVFYDEEEKEIFTHFEKIGNTTNNVAEWTAFIKALEFAIEKEFLNLEVNMDSELVVKQFNGEYKTKNPEMKNLKDRANLLTSKFGKILVKHIPREKNARADKLANSAFK